MIFVAVINNKMSGHRHLQARIWPNP